ncbi:hypothetical protein R3P38DRAFT_2772001 [Favolaschia claudopus]|uniref:Uncharacterized protein n=1 Tax=Favolaschia claudopus TaxID=2862362 RepID=A0AAW0C643_9AGAR
MISFRLDPTVFQEFIMLQIYPFLCMSILARGFPLMATDNESTSKFGQPALENGIIKQGFLSANLLAELEVDVSNNGIIFDIKFGDSIPQAVPPSSNITSTVLGSRSAETLATVVGGSSFAATTTIVQSSVAPSIPSASFRASAVQTSFHSPTSSHSGTGSVSQPESFSASTSIAASASRAMFSSLPSSGLSQTSSAVSPSSSHNTRSTAKAQHSQTSSVSFASGRDAPSSSTELSSDMTSTSAAPVPTGTPCSCAGNGS